MKKPYFLIIGFCLCALTIGIISFRVSTTTLYGEYSKLWNYRILSPDFLPNSDAIILSSAGHTTTYADTIWMRLIQFIGDNLRDDGFREFLHPLISVITELHPHFPGAYNLALLLAPEIKDDANKETSRRLNEEALEIGKKGIEKTCDPSLIKAIEKREFSYSLWEDISLKNPCTDGMLPYYLAYVSNELGYYEGAERYYKIASMNDDAPKASRFLGPLVEAKKGEYRKAAERFILIGIE
jgi:hypothetical protein